MPYVTLAQLIERYGEPALVAVTDRGQFATGVVDEAAIDRAIADADAVIDGYLVRKYALPLAEAQPMLVKIAGSLVFYDLHTYQPDEKIVNDQKLALAMLRDIAAGTVALTVAGLEPANVSGSGARITDRDRQLTQDNMTGFI
jgi:phage gp36-like protein